MVMKAAWYEKQGVARDVLVVGTMDDPQPQRGEVRIRIAASGVNPGDVKKRNDAFGYGMAYRRVVPHSDGAGTIDAVGDDVSADWIGRRVWCYGAQSYRPFGTAAQFTVVPLEQAVPLPDHVSFEIGATLGIPGITAHRAVHIAGDLHGRNVLVLGRGAVGSMAIMFAERAGARVVQSIDDVKGTIDHVIDVDFGAHIEAISKVLAQGASITAYATSNPNPAIPFWPLLFQNVRIFLIGSDDFPRDAKHAAATAINAALESGWPGPRIARRFPLDDIALAHEAVESGKERGRIVVTVE